MGIGKELFIFLLAILAGAIVRLAYRCISCLREVVHHAHWVIELEDLIYWIGTAIFLFVQIYYTSSGSVRWYFVADNVGFIKITTDPLSQTRDNVKF